jgi:hypothetical protein
VSASPAAREGRRARKPVHYRGRKVPKTTVDTAERLLDVFNETTGSGLGARKGDGRPSPALKQVVGALLDREAPAEVWERGVRAMLADPPDWIEDRITVGHLFGPRAAEHTLARGRTDTSPRRAAAADVRGRTGARSPSTSRRGRPRHDARRDRTALQQVTRRWGPVPAARRLRSTSGSPTWSSSTADQVEHAIRRLSGREFPPNSGQVAAEIRRDLQGPAPGFDEMLGAVWRALPLRVFITAGSTARPGSTRRARPRRPSP